MKTIEKFFSNPKLFKISGFIGAICFVINAALLIIGDCFIENVYAIFISLILSAFILLIIFLTNKHYENAVKGLIGTIFGVIFSYDLRIFALHVMDFTALELSLGIIKLLVDILFFAVYIIARSNKNGSSKIISLCQSVFGLLVVVIILNNVPYFVSDFFDPNRCWIIQDFAETIAFISIYFSIMCATTIVNKYKIIRENYREKGEWTEEVRSGTKEELFK